MKNFDDFIYHLSNLISFRSVKAPKKDDMPFGEGVFKAYDYFMTLAKEMGFETINYDNYIGEVVLGDGEELGIIGHLDVVPEGTGWDSDPYTLTKIDDTFYGRGVMDDKAPLLMCLFALKELSDEGVKFNKKIRLFAGTDEESDWQDIAYFNQNHKFPEYGFSPDGNFPVVYAEKGMNKATFKLPPFKNFKDMTGGTVFNAVCGKCSIKPLFSVDEAELKDYGLLYENGLIVSVGKSCHGSRPHLGINAMKKMFEYMLYKGEDVKNALDYLFYDKKGVFKMANEQGGVTLSPNIVSEVNGNTHILCDVRIPAPMTLNELLPIFDSFDVEYSYEIHRAPLYVPKESEFVQKLLKAYNTATGENSQPESMSGGTFAYVFDKGCAFGPEFKGLNSGIHEPNERATKSDLIKMYNVYKSAIKSLVE